MCSKSLIDAAHKHLGRPWNANGFDCWECVRAIYSDAFGIVLASYGDHQKPDVARHTILAEAESGRWTEIQSAEDGCVVMLGRREFPHHVGVFINCDGGKIIHCEETSGCVVCSVSLMRRAGWGFMRFYKLAGRP